MGKLAVVLIVVVVAATACLGGSTSATKVTGGASSVSARTRLRIAVGSYSTQRLAPPAGTPHFTRDYTLTCQPTGGTMPDAAAACAALADLQHRRIGGCIGVLSMGGWTADLTGAFQGRPYDLDLTAAYSWCGQSRAVLHDYWVLSTFPCTVEVLREGGEGIDTNYPAWPHWAGCVPTPPVWMRDVPAREHA